jgi:hypothetical protein
MSKQTTIIEEQGPWDFAMTLQQLALERERERRRLAVRRRLF